MVDAATVPAASSASPIVGTLPHRGDVALHERPIGSLVQIAVWPGGVDGLLAALGPHGVRTLPESGRSLPMRGGMVMDAGPGRWLIERDAPGLANDFADLLNEHGTATDLSYTRVRLDLTGPRAAWVLAKGTSVDLRERAFPDGTVAWTAIYGIGLAIRREGVAFALYPYRGFARALTEWLHEAMRPDGR